MWLMNLSPDEIRQAREVLDSGLGLLPDIAYVDYASRFHKILRRSLRLPDETLELNSVVKFMSELPAIQEVLTRLPKTLKP